MKKAYILNLSIVIVLSLGVLFVPTVRADDEAPIVDEPVITIEEEIVVSPTPVPSMPPVVSIGLGNSNNPENTGPIHLGVFHGDIPVFATVTDDDLENYHFRVIKDGDVQGHTCEEPIEGGALFAPENQGYASTTLNKTACGFSFNQSVYTTLTGFTNTLIATLNTIDLAVFGGEGNYWLILGARDMDDNRVAPDYLSDPRVQITIDNTAPVTVATTSASSINSPITITGISTDSNGVSGVKISSSSYDGTTCGAFSEITNISALSSNSFLFSFIWTPDASGSYCLGANATDKAGNVESSTVFATNLAYEVVSVPPNTGSTEGNGSNGGGGAGGNGPIVGSYGVTNSNYPIVNTTTPNAPVTNQVADVSNEIKTTVAVNTEDPVYPDSISSITLAQIDEATTSTIEVVSSSTSGQLAQVGDTGFNLNWLWTILAVVVLGGITYFFVRKQ